jgi:hypothetical protein
MKSNVKIYLSVYIYAYFQRKRVFAAQIFFSILSSKFNMKSNVKIYLSIFIYAYFPTPHHLYKICIVEWNVCLSTGMISFLNQSDIVTEIKSGI